MRAEDQELLASEMCWRMEYARGKVGDPWVGTFHTGLGDWAVGRRSVPVLTSAKENRHFPILLGCSLHRVSHPLAWAFINTEIKNETI